MKKSKRDVPPLKGGSGTPQHEQQDLSRGGGAICSGATEECGAERCRIRESGNVCSLSARETCSHECSFVHGGTTLSRHSTSQSHHCSSLPKGSSVRDNVASTSKCNKDGSSGMHSTLFNDAAACAGRCLCSCHCAGSSSGPSNHEAVVVTTTPPTSPHKSHGLLGTLRKKFNQMMKRDTPSSEPRSECLLTTSPRAKSSDRASGRNGTSSRSRTLPRKTGSGVVLPGSGPSTPAGPSDCSFETFDAHRGRSFRRQRTRATESSASVTPSGTLSPSRLHRIIACPFRHDSYRSSQQEPTPSRKHESPSTKLLADPDVKAASSIATSTVPDTGYGHASAPTPLDADGDQADTIPLGAMAPFYDQVKDSTLNSTATGWSLTRELFKLPKYGWYWGPIARSEAEERLAGQPDGAFLLRDSSDDRYLLSLSFRSDGRTLHTRIEHCNGLFSFYAQPESEGYSSVVDLIERSMSDSQSGVFCYSRARTPGSPSFPVRLARPVSRFTQVRSLQYLCRFVIRQHTRVDYIQRLPLPTSIKGWLEETQY